MTELDDLARRAAAQAHEEAHAIADTEQALADLHAGLATAEVRQLPSRSRWRPLLAIAAALVAIVALGATALFVGRDADERPTDTAVTLPDTVPDTAPDTVPVTTVAPSLSAVTLRHGLTIDALPEAPVAVVHQELPGLGDRATYQATMRFADDRLLIAGIGERPNRVDVEAADVNGVGGLVSDTFVAWQAGTGDWLSLATRSGSPPESSFAAVFTRDELITLAETLFYEPTLDSRTFLPTYDPTAVPATCGSDVEVLGGATRNLVLATCDGTLAVYDGATGERTELIQQFDDPRGPLPEEGPGPTEVDGLDVSPDGTTVWFSTGPEPAVGNLYRYRLGSGAAPELIGFGRDPSVSPDGTLVAVATLDGISILSTETLAEQQGWFFDGLLYPSAFAWGPDGRELAFEARGAIGVLDVTTGDIELRANNDTAVIYSAPSYYERGLEAWAQVGATGSPELAVIGGQGNQLTLEAGGPGGLVAPIRLVRSPDGGAGTVLQGDVLGPPEGPAWATGVRWAALLP